MPNYGPDPAVLLASLQAEYLQSYHTIQYYNNSATAVAAGAVVNVGTVPMIAQREIPAYSTGALTFVGQANVVKDTSTFSQGDAVYWNSTGNPVGGVAGTGCATSTPSAYLMGFYAGYTAIGAGDTRLAVEMTAAKRTTTIAGSVTADDITGSDAALGIAGLAGTAGGAISVTGGTGSAGVGGAITIVGGTATGAYAGGALGLTGGTGGAAGAGGAISLTAGHPASGNANGGALALVAGAGSGTGVGGAVTLTSGASAGASGTAGALAIDTGAATGGTGAGITIGGTNATGLTVGCRSTFSKSVLRPCQSALTALGSAAAAITADKDIVILLSVTTATTYGWTLPTGVAGMVLTLVNTAAYANTLIPATGGTINGLSANAGVTIAASKCYIAVCTAADTWHVMEAAKAAAA